MIITSVTSGSYAPLLARAEQIDKLTLSKSKPATKIVIQPRMSPSTTDTVTLSTAARMAYLRAAAEPSENKFPVNETTPEKVMRNSYLVYAYQMK